MVSHNRHSFTQMGQSSIATNSLRFFVAFMFLSLFMVSPAFGQADYSTMWFDDSQGDQGIGAMIGAGVTEYDYTSDLIEVETTLVSPDGRTITDGTFDYVSGRVEVSLSVSSQSSFFGIWRVYSHHSSICFDPSMTEGFFQIGIHDMASFTL